MKKIYLLILAAFFTHLNLQAQSNFKPGYIITLRGDTVRGQIDYREWNNSPEEIKFKTISGDAQKYTPAEIQYFSINGMESYKKYSGPISHDETNENRITSGRDTSFFTKEAFLRVLTKGKTITLYSYADATKVRYFFSEPADNTPHELIPHVLRQCQYLHCTRAHGKRKHLCAATIIGGAKG